jgi:hypothetical protein
MPLILLFPSSPVTFVFWLIVQSGIIKSNGQKKKKRKEKKRGKREKQKKKLQTSAQSAKVFSRLGHNVISKLQKKERIEKREKQKKAKKKDKESKRTSMMIRPARLPPIEISKKTRGFPDMLWWCKEEGRERNAEKPHHQHSLFNNHNLKQSDNGVATGTDSSRFASEQTKQTSLSVFLSFCSFFFQSHIDIFH